MNIINFPIFAVLLRCSSTFPNPGSAPVAWNGFEVVTADHWKKLIEHVREKVEDLYWSCEGLYMYKRYTQRFIIEFGERDSDGSTSGEEVCTSNTDNAVSDGRTSEDEATCDCDCS